MSKRMMSIGASIRGLGYNASAWRHPDVDPTVQESIYFYAEAAKKAEAAKLDFVFLADNLAATSMEDRPKGALGRGHDNITLEPLTAMAAIAVLTNRIGLVATCSTSYQQPYHVARQYASLDHISGGRAAWNVVPSYRQTEGANFGLAAPLSHSERYERAEEFVTVVQGLWDSWDPDAFLYDKKSGVFFDPAKVRALHHRGKFFQVEGPLTAARSPQGRPAIFQAGESGAGVELAAKFADAVYTVPLEKSASIQQRQLIRQTAAKHGRSEDAVKVIPGIQPIVAATRKKVEEKLELLRSIADPVKEMGRLIIQFKDISKFDLDEILPESFVESCVTSSARPLAEKAVASKWNVRRLCQEMAIGQQRIVAGTPEEIASDLADWFDSGACDGFNVSPSHMPGGLFEFLDQVVPILQDRGSFRAEYAGRTLREHLGVARNLS
ncbi:NtaA/DmoA family FMN-dependent monooxygenase [Bradyrhizobium cajani]|uniref:NtaA/DmoA family FMN-dependent monooxygenase n=1 Tax=Bradyrhizobium cajani TaxID=1928661 RepID=A0A844TKF5_9BRAD|nr:NtaA/DmoA family FMN-dependent monooxygenase [Bradyrhizobium cajani]MCP3374410.1 NtaA/DmoA family FMN-dependent monooxygenase [Bradyrhizobium cajani]MVT76344.1 NtaA/DmoA family FMN-dependent monooxygenase [Bradyrhizobium cajani]